MEIQKKRELKSQNDFLKLRKESLEFQNKQKIIAEELYKLGKINYYDFKMQEYLCSEAELKYFAQRYQCIIRKLEMQQ